MPLRPAIALLSMLCLAFTAGCNTTNTAHLDDHPVNLVAVLAPTPGNTAHGVVHFSEPLTMMKQGDLRSVRIIANIDGLQPNSTHAFHIHEYGDATKPDATSAGPHFNPTHDPHGHPDDAHRHAGDLGNITADARGHVHYDRVITLPDAVRPAALLGRAVILHAAPDKFTQPAGDAGSRIAIGIIGLANPHP